MGLQPTSVQPGNTMTSAGTASISPYSSVEPELSDSLSTAVTERRSAVKRRSQHLGETDNQTSLRHFIHMSSLVSLAVVFLHSHGQPRADEGPLWALETWNFINGAVGLLRMPLFFFISGFLFLHTNPPNKSLRYLPFLRKKTIRLLIPYVALSSLAYPIKVLLSQYALRPASFSISEYALSLADPMRNPIAFYWFLGTLYVMFLFAPIFRYLIIKSSMPAVAAITAGLLVVRWYAAGILWFSPDHATSLFALMPAAGSFFYFWIGMVAWKWKDRWTVSLHPALAALGVVAILAYYVTLAQANSHIRFMATLLGIYSVYCLIEFYVRRGWSFLRFIDGRTYQVYLLAWFPQQFVIVVLYKILHWDYWVCSALMFLGGIVLPLLTARLVEWYLPAAAVFLGIRLKPQPAAVPVTA